MIAWTDYPIGNAQVADFAYARYRALVGKRCALVLDGRRHVGVVLGGMRYPTARDGGAPRFRFRCRETHYCTLEAALRLREVGPKGAP